MKYPTEYFVFLVLNILCMVQGIEEDPKGYIVYCPCMGRFGNQADQFLGVLGFAKALDRTLILPPWVEYNFPKPTSDQVPFDTYFKVEGIQEFVRAITMETFMKELAPTVWPPEERSVFCYQARHGKGPVGCNAKDGNPFGPFWNTFNIDFTESVFYGPLYYDYINEFEMKRWKDKYPASKYKVLAFTGAPGAFPVQQHSVSNQKYLQWSDNINNKVKQFISTNFPDGHFLGIHLRLGSDFEKACEHVGSGSSLFASAQCLGYNNEKGTLTKKMCYPPDDVIVKQIKKAAKDLKLTNVFVATDSPGAVTRIAKKLKQLTFKTLQQPSPHVDLAILGQADHYICGCVSTFAAFATRERTSQGKTTDFWAFKPKTKNKHEEL